MHSLWNFFLERRAFTILTMSALTLTGIYALLVMPKEAAPEVSIPYGIVSVTLPGATATDVERLIIDKLEPTLQNVANVDKIHGTARPSLATISVQFDQNADLNIGIQDIRNAIERAKGDLPSDASAPVVTKIDTTDQPILMVAVSTPLAPETLASLGDDLKDTLSTINGVSKVDVLGVREREIAVVVSQEALRAHRMSAGQILAALRTANASLPVGTITIDGIQYPVQFKGEVTEVADIREIPITTPGGTVTLSDIATIIDGYEKAGSISHLGTVENGTTYALMLNVYKSKGGSILKVSEAVQAKLTELGENTLRGSEAIVTYDAAKEVRTNISDLTRAGFDTVVLVMIVLFIAIGLREAIVSALSIPLSFVIAFIGMWATGNTINFLSLFSLIIAIGILVDSGIVVVEAIHTNREKGMDKLEAARTAIRQYSWPLIAGTMTTVAVFFPLFFLSGIIGEYMSTIPFTVIVVLLASIVVALGFVPLIALAFLKHEESAWAVRREKAWEQISAWYRAKMTALFADRKAQRLFLGFLLGSFVFAMSLPITGMLKVSMFQAADQDFFYVEVELPEASALEATEKATHDVEAVIGKTSGVASYTTTIGSTSAFSNQGSTSNSKYANITVNLLPERDAAHSSMAIAQKLRTEFAKISNGSKITVTEAIGGPPSGAPVMINVWSNDTKLLAQGLEYIERTVREHKDTRDVTSSLDTDGTQISMIIDRTKANEYGLSAMDIATLLQAGVSGVEATTVRIGGDDVDVRMKFNLNKNFIDPSETTNTDTTALGTIPVATARGVVPMSTFVTTTAERGAAEINHENGDRVGRVSAYLKGEANAVQVTNEIKKTLEGGELPEGVRVTYGGDTEDIAKTFTEMIISLFAGIVLMFAILVLEFDAFRTSGRLLLAIPLSLTGVLIGLWITGQPLSITAMLGIIALGGVIINHGILLLDVLNNLRKRDANASAEDIVLGAATTRIRPILLTTITTIVGMIPLVFVSAMWAPLAYTIAFGLLYGTVLTLIFIPLLSYRQEVKNRAK